MSVHRRVFLPLYLPALLLGIPAQAAYMLLPLYVLERGGSAAEAAAVMGMRGLGMMAGLAPAQRARSSVTNEWEWHGPIESLAFESPPPSGCWAVFGLQAG